MMHAIRNATFLILICLRVAAAQDTAGVVVRLRHAASPVSGARVRLDDAALLSDARGEVRFRAPLGRHVLAIDRIGFADTAFTISVPPTGVTTTVELVEVALEEEAVVASAVRGSTVVADQPIRVVAVPLEEIEENQTISPGSITTLLQELPGVRLDQSVPGLGGAGLRIRGMPSRHTQVLIDNLPLLGPEPDAFSLLQTPPLDLAHVEVLPGIASAMFGGAALGGVLNLVSKRPVGDATMLLNQSSIGESDGIVFLPARFARHWGATLTAGAHRQKRNDVDHDGWAEIAGYKRAEARPRLFFNDGRGSELMLTTGVSAENRKGGSAAYREALDTRRFDVGLNGHHSTDNGLLLTARGSFTHQGHDRTFATRSESDERNTGFAEISVGGTNGIHSWVAGTAIQTDELHAAVNPGADYSYSTPAVFLQDEIGFGNSFRFSVSGRYDHNNVFGSFVSPRVSALYHVASSLSVRASAGSGWALPTVLIEEVEAVGLGKLLPPQGLQVEKARGASLDISWLRGPFEISTGLFASRLQQPLSERTNRTTSTPKIELYNAETPRHTRGVESLAHYRYRALQLLMSYTYLDAWEANPSGGERMAERVPRHAGEIGAILERELVGRFGIEVAYNGKMRIENDPYRQYTRPYAEMNLLAAKAFGETQLFFNALNLFNVRQSKVDPLLRPSPSSVGQPATDIWAPLAGRMFNLGIQIEM